MVVSILGTRNHGALRAPPLLAPAPKGHYTDYAKILAPKSGVDTHGVCW